MRHRIAIFIGSGAIGAMAVSLLVVAAAPAQAETFCAPEPCEEGTPVATIEGAVGLADENAGPDTVAIQPGTFETPMEGCNGLFVEEEDTHVRGAGIDQTILTFPPLKPEDGFTRNVICGHMHLSDLTLRLPSDVTPEQNSGVQGLDLYSGLVERVKVDAVGATLGPGENDGAAEAMLLRKGAAREIEVDLDPSEDTYGIETGYLDELRDVTVRARSQGLASRVAQEPGEPPMRVSRVVLQTASPLSVSNESGLDARMELSDAVLDASGAPPSVPTTGVSVFNGLPPESIQLALDRVTIVGNGAPKSVAMTAYGQGEPLPTVLEARHVVATGFEKTVLAGKFGGNVNVSIDHSDLDSSPAAIAEEGSEGAASVVFGPGNRSGDPLFLSPATGDYRLAFGSPAIDVGGEDLIPGEATDLGGSPRPTDGNGDGAVLADAGAFEHPTEFDERVTIVILGKRLRLNRRGVALLRLRCPQAEQTPPCRGAVVLRTRSRVSFEGKRRRLVLVRGRFSIGAGRTAQVRLKVAPKKAKLLRSIRGARRVVAVAQVTDGAGNRSSSRKSMRIAP